jgi:hypothetical protein
MRTTLLLLLALNMQAAGLDQLDFMAGKWRGTSTGQPGNGTVEKECARILNDRFLECRTVVTYAKEVHVERALYSFDKKTKKLRLRQFHGEGFVNTYTEEGALTFVTTDIENIPAGWRARETSRATSADSIEETFELAEPGKDFAPYSASKLERIK